MEDHIYITIAKVLQGEASPAERRELDEWLAADAGNKVILADMQAIWAESDVLLAAPEFDTAKAWESVSARISPAEETLAPPRGRTMAFPQWLKYSTAVAAILLIAILVIRPFGSKDVQIAATTADKRVELPDGSVITLRQGSTLRYPEKFIAASRNVALEGEAFFDVARDEAHPFIIDAKSVSVRVLGTSFNVQCSDSAADVAVSTGRVQVTASADKARTAVLTPGNKAHYSGGSLTQGASLGYESAWASDSLSFNGTPFSTVLATIAFARKVPITAGEGLSPAQLQQAITITFRRELAVEEMLTELCLITGTRWEKTGAAYIIRKK